MAAVAPSAVHAADLLQMLSLVDPKSEGGKGPETKDRASGGLKGVSKGEVVSLNPPASSAEPWAQQDYKDATMYYGADPGAYYCGGWGDYSVYVSQDGGDPLSTGVYGDMYCYPHYGIADGQIYGSQHYQYPSTYHQPKTTASKPAYKAKAGKSSPSTQDVSTATAADQQPVLLDSSKTTLKSIDGVKGLKKETLPLKPNGRSGNYQNQGSKTAYPGSGGRTSSEKHLKFSGGNPTSTGCNNNKESGSLFPLWEIPHHSSSFCFSILLLFE